ncbi:MAG: hypothetical protein WDZ94_00640 [Patescibacteria group bacterium]
MNLKHVLVGVGALALSVGVVSASSHLLEPFTQTELDTNWEADRAFPTDGVTSVSDFGRDDVARIGIDSSETAPGTFQRTEGIKTVGDQNFGTEVQVDLYVDSDWQDSAVRSGFWVVGDNDTTATGSAARDNWFGIIEYVNLEPADSGDSAADDHQGWRFWDSTNGWTEVAHPVTYDEWATLKIVLDTDAQEYHYFINDDQIGTGPAGEHFIREIFLNSYNYGLDSYPNLNSDSYAAHWHVGVEAQTPTSKDDCKKGGWMNLVDEDGNQFKNQGQCVSSVATQGAPGRNR